MRGLIFLIFLLGFTNILFCGYSLLTNNFFHYFISLFMFFFLVVSTLLYSNSLYPNTTESEMDLLEMKTKDE
jgi:hypothetical protein